MSIRRAVEETKALVDLLDRLGRGAHVPVELDVQGGAAPLFQRAPSPPEGPGGTGAGPTGRRGGGPLLPFAAPAGLGGGVPVGGAGFGSVGPTAGLVDPSGRPVVGAAAGGSGGGGGFTGGTGLLYPTNGLGVGLTVDQLRQLVRDGQARETTLGMLGAGGQVVEVGAWLTSWGIYIMPGQGLSHGQVSLSSSGGGGGGGGGRARPSLGGTGIGIRGGFAAGRPGGPSAPYAPTSGAAVAAPGVVGGSSVRDSENLARTARAVERLADAVQRDAGLPLSRSAGV